MFFLGFFFQTAGFVAKSSIFCFSLIQQICVDRVISHNQIAGYLKFKKESLIKGIYV